MSGAELRKLRQAAGLSQRELAARLGVARVSVTRWEIGQRPIVRMTELAIRQVLRARGTRRQSDPTATPAERSLGTAGHAAPVAED